jgi:hypothetical protein
VTSYSRIRALCRLNKLGLYFTKEKQEAILRGDSSNAVVHRHFVDGLQAIGIHLGGTPDEIPALIRLQARYAQAAWESLIQLNQTDQERDKAQALVLLAHAFIILKLTAGAQLYLLKACMIIGKAKLKFLPEYGPPTELSEQTREEFSVLSQAIYLENYFYLTLGGTAPVKTAEIEQEFRVDLQVRIARCPFVVEVKIDSVIRSSECTHACSKYAH